MSYLVEADVRAVGKRASAGFEKTAKQNLRESAADAHFNVFLSHSYADKELVVGVVEILERANLSVYVDWLVDPELVRSDVTKQSAEKLRTRMRQCDGMFYLWTEKAGDSRWMPWELGFFDGLRGKIAVLPVLASAGSTFKDTEFVGLYPVVEVSQIAGKRIVQVAGVAPISWLRPTQTFRLRG